MLELLPSAPWKNMYQTDSMGYFWREGEETKPGSGVNVDFIFYISSYLYN